MTATKFQPGDDTHLSLLMAHHSLNFVTDADHAALLAYGRDVFAAGRDSKCLAQIEEPAPAQAVQTAPQIKLSAAVRGVGVVDDCDTALAVYFTAVPRKEDIRALHDALTKESSPQAAPALEAPAAPASEQYDELHATLMGLRVLCENISSMERRVGPLGSHARGYTWKITEALRHLDALAAAPQAPAAPTAVVPDAWQPIETAPKNGRLMLLGYINSCGKWRTARGQWINQEYIDEYAEDPELMSPGWYETTIEDDDGKCWPIEPTRWQPLPPPPQGFSNDQ